MPPYMLAVVLLAPVPSPTKVLSSPAMLKTRLFAMLYWADVLITPVALRTLAVPLPLMLKLVPVCGEVVLTAGAADHRWR
jgi:hypothetical protein